MIRTKQSGFTAVELLITLFVAVAFLVAGYSLYNVVIKDGGQTRGETRASNVAYDYMRRYVPTATNPCAVSNPLTNSPITVTGIGSVTVSIAITCPYANNTAISKIEATVLYNNPQQTIKYSTLTTGAGSTGTTISPTGLIGWWKFNGNANDSSPTGANGTITGGATLATGQNGQPNSSYFFAATQYITTTALPQITSSLSVSAWLYPLSYPSERSAIVVNPAGGSTDGYYFSVNTDGSLQSYWYGTSSPGYHTTASNTITLNQWNFTTVVWNGSQVKLYINGVLQTTVATGGGKAASTAVNIGNQSNSTGRQFVGRIDDVRMYNRALSDIEVSNLYAEGAQ